MIVTAYKFDSKNECLEFLDSMQKNGVFSSDKLFLTAQKYAKHDKELYDFFIEEGKKRLPK